MTEHGGEPIAPAPSPFDPPSKRDGGVLAAAGTRSTRRPSAAVKAKADRYLAESAVRHVGGPMFDVHGDSGVWRVIVEGDRLTCRCPVRRGVCAHVVAVARLVREWPR